MTDFQIQRANELRSSIQCLKDMLKVFETPTPTITRAKKKIFVSGYIRRYQGELQVDSYKMDSVSLSAWKQANIDFLNFRISQLELELVEL